MDPYWLSHISIERGAQIKRKNFIFVCKIDNFLNTSLSLITAIVLGTVFVYTANTGFQDVLFLYFFIFIILKLVQATTRIRIFKPSNIFFLLSLWLGTIFLLALIEFFTMNAQSSQSRALQFIEKGEWKELWDAALTYDINGHLIWTDWQDGLVSQQIRKEGLWEFSLTALWPHIIKPKQIILSLGGHIGYHILQISDLIGKDGRILCFEANPRTFDILQANLKLNFVENVQIFQKAVYYKNTSLPFMQVEGNTGGSYLFTENQTVPNWEHPIQVDAIKLDDFLGYLDHIDVIQMDIEGLEYWAMKGAEKLLTRSFKVTIISEWLPDLIKKSQSVEAVLIYWNEKGFTFFDVSVLGLQILTKEELIESKHRNILLTRDPKSWIGIQLK